MSIPPLPPGTRLLHIGPHKTGTTALQAALVKARDELPAYGVIYPGRSNQHAMAARAMTGRRGPRGDAPALPRHRDRLLREVAAAGDSRVIISSESFAMADDATAREIVSQLGGDRVHVLVTLRPLSKVMPSSWQQYVREGLTSSYSRWLAGMLREPPFDVPTPTFWQRHAHDVLVDRWAKAADHRVTVVVVDSRDRSMLTNSVADLVGIPHELLDAEPVRSNRSLTFPEIELVRGLTLEFRRRAWSDETFRSFVREGMIRHLQDTRTPPADEPQIPTPAWALHRAAEIGSEAAARIGTLGVRVLGDLTLLSDGADASGLDEIAPVQTMPIELARDALVGILEVSVPARAQPPVPVDAARPPTPAPGSPAHRLWRGLKVRSTRFRRSRPTRPAAKD